MKTRFGPAFRWQLREYGLGVFTFWAAMLALEAFFVGVSLIALAHGEGTGESNFNGAGSIAWFCYFVLGLAQVRADLRLGAQFGIPRRTMMKATWAAALLTGACLALALELLTGAGQLMLAGKERLYVGDLYQSLYLAETGGVMSLGSHLASAAFNLCGMLAAFGAGAALSLVLWLFGRVRWVVLACLALPAAVSGLLWLAATLGVDPTPLLPLAAGKPPQLRRVLSGGGGPHRPCRLAGPGQGEHPPRRGVNKKGGEAARLSLWGEVGRPFCVKNLPNGRRPIAPPPGAGV